MGKGRAPCCDKNKVKRGPWSPAEDFRLISFIQNHGHDNWRALPKQAGLLRCGKSCRLRWINYLRPDVKRGNFTEDEEETVIKLHKAWGNKWSKIASRLPGRTDNEIKNVWNTHLKKRFKVSENQIKSKSSSSSPSSPTTTTSTSTTTTSSSSSNSSTLLSTSNKSKNTATKPDGHGGHDQPPLNSDNNNNNNLLKEQTASNCSVLSSESTNTSNSSTTTTTTQPDTVSMEIPFESDIDFWNMLDLDNIDQLFQHSSNDHHHHHHQSESDQVLMAESAAAVAAVTDDFQGSNFGGNIEIKDPQFENNNNNNNHSWFKYLENELGLVDHQIQLPKTQDEEQIIQSDQHPDNSSELYHYWSKSNPAIDPCVAYFQMGSPILTP